MSFKLLGPGDDAPNSVNVVIEIPANGSPVKYEVDKTSGTLFVDRFLGTAMYYPCNYGYVPQTLSLDGDPVDVLVITPAPLLSGSVIKSRPIGMLKMTDESGEDNKILAVPISKLCPLYDEVHAPSDVAPQLLATITHFFEHYKDLEPNKWVRVESWDDKVAAEREIHESIARFEEK